MQTSPPSVRKVVVADSAWHYLALGMNREGGQAEIYVDGIKALAAPIPAGFGPLRNPTDSAFQLGYLTGGYPTRGSMASLTIPGSRYPLILPPRSGRISQVSVRRA